MTLQPDQLPTRFSHHVFYNQPGSRIALAVCGYLIARTDSVVDPTCPICRTILAEHERKLQSELEEACS